jgi:hypothetical protein
MDMVNKCVRCNRIMDEQWMGLQQSAKNKNLDLLFLPNKMFIERCIYCYSEFLILFENEQSKWYNTILDRYKK